MLDIRSRVDGGPIATIIRAAELADMDGGEVKRDDYNAPHESLQVARIRVKEPATFKAHKHIPNPRTVEMTQESWYCIDGCVRVSLFDVDDKPIVEPQPFVLNGGDLLNIHRGGHGYYCEAGTVVLEFKAPQFVGREVDKVLL